MTPPRVHEVLLSAAEMQAGRAMRRCPCCLRDVVIAMPPVIEALRQEDRPSLREHLPQLSPRERQLFDVLYERADWWTTHEQLTVMVFGPFMSRSATSTTLYRLRRKLTSTVWRVVIARPLGQHELQTYQLQRTNGKRVAA